MKQAKQNRRMNQKIKTIQRYRRQLEAIADFWDGEPWKKDWKLNIKKGV